MVVASYAVTVMAPPLVQAPFPLDPSRVNDVRPVTVIVNVPFAAVFPDTPLMETFAPVWRLLGSAVPIAIGLAFDAPVTAMVVAAGSFATASRIDWSTTVAGAAVNASELAVADWWRSR